MTPDELKSNNAVCSNRDKEGQAVNQPERQKSIIGEKIVQLHNRPTVKYNSRNKNSNKRDEMQPVGPSECMVLNGKEFYIEVKQGSIRKRNKNKLIDFNIGLIHQGKYHLDPNQQKPCSQDPVCSVRIPLGGNHQPGKKSLGKSDI